MLSALSILGVLGLAGGAVNYYVFPVGLKMGLGMFVNLKENGMVYPLYMDPPFPSKTTFHIFEITNPRDVLKGKRMKLRLRGPYNYKTYLKRWDIEFKNKSDILKFNSARNLVFDAEGSSSDYDDKMWLLNPVLPTIQAQIQNIILDKIPFQRLSEPIVLNSANLLLDSYKERLISKTTPRNLLEGRKVYLLDFIIGLSNRFGLGSIIPKGPPDNVFGLVYVQNKTVDAMEIWTGIANKDRFADIQSWNGNAKLTVWRGSCNLMTGTNGELYKPYQMEAKPIRVFLAQLCRSFYMEPVSGELEEVNYGIKGYEYKLSQRLYQGVRSYPKNKCFCKNANTYDCQYDGLLSMGPCFFGSPIYFTQGNFKGVDQKIKGLIDENAIEYEQIPEKQSFYVEPISGTLMKVNLTLVATVKIVKQAFMRDLAYVQNLTYAPLFTVTETVEIPYEILRPLKYLQMMTDNYKTASVVTASAGSSLLAWKMFASLFR